MSVITVGKGLRVTNLLCLRIERSGVGVNMIQKEQYTEKEVRDFYKEIHTLKDGCYSIPVSIWDKWSVYRGAKRDSLNYDFSD